MLISSSMRAIISHSAVPRDDLEVVMARLDAVVCHVGSIDRGHYFTLVRNSLNNRWFLYDDDAIFEITEAFALSFHMEPYMLIYTREKP